MFSIKANLRELKQFAYTFGQCVEKGDTLFLKGGLGTGKTSFARFFVQSLCGKNITVPSPTFTLIQTYTTPKGSLWHCDLYRLKNVYEVEELGLLEILSSTICLIEWPDILEKMTYYPHIDISFEIMNDQERQLTFTPNGHGRKSLLDQLRQLTKY